MLLEGCQHFYDGMLSIPGQGNNWVQGSPRVLDVLCTFKLQLHPSSDQWNIRPLRSLSFIPSFYRKENGRGWVGVETVRKAGKQAVLNISVLWQLRPGGSMWFPLSTEDVDERGRKLLEARLEDFKTWIHPDSVLRRWLKFEWEGGTASQREGLCFERPVRRRPNFTFACLVADCQHLEL